jgi:ribosome-binding protein aMBF1 (putative translation factor)
MTKKIIEKMPKLKNTHLSMMKNDAKYRDAFNSLEAEYSLLKAMIEAKEKSGLNQKEIAEKMGTSQAAFSRMMSGGQTPSWQTIAKFAEAIGAKPVLNFI